mgnify:CR=1 FL=1
MEAIDLPAGVDSLVARRHHPSNNPSAHPARHLVGTGGMWRVIQVPIALGHPSWLVKERADEATNASLSADRPSYRWRSRCQAPISYRRTCSKRAGSAERPETSQSARHILGMSKRLSRDFTCVPWHRAIRRAARDATRMSRALIGLPDFEGAAELCQASSRPSDVQPLGRRGHRGRRTDADASGSPGGGFGSGDRALGCRPYHRD